MAIKKSMIYNTIGAVGVVAVPTGITLGVVYGTTVADPHLLHKSAVTTGAKMFDKEIAGATSEYATTAIINPEHGIDLSELVRLDKNMDSAGARKMIALDDKGNSTSAVWKKTIDMQNMSSEDANDALSAANKELADYIKTGEGKNKNLGIYVGKDINERQIIISLYKVREIDNKLVSNDDLKYLNDFIGDIGGIDGSNINPSSYKQFFEMFAGEMGITMDDVTSYYHFGQGSKLVASNKGSASEKAAAFVKAFAAKYPQAIQDGAVNPIAISNNNPARNKWSNNPQKDGYAKPYRLKNPEGKESLTHFYFTGLAQRNMFMTVKPVVDWNAGEIKLIIRYSLLDKSNKESYLDYTTRADYVHNALATKTVVKKYSLSTIVGDAGKNSKIEADAKYTKEQKYDIFRQALVAKTKGGKLVDGIKGSYKHFISRSIVQPGLLMLGKVMPSLGTRTTGLVNVVNTANSMGVNLKNTFTDEYIQKLFDILENDPTVNAKEWFDQNIVAFSKDEGAEEYKDDNNFYWSSLTSLLALGPKPFVVGAKNDDGEGGQYKMFSMFSGWGAISDSIMKQIKKVNPGVALLSSSNLIENLFSTLKEQSIIPDTLTINTLIGNPFKYVKEILLNVYKNGLSLSETEINDLVHAIPVAFISESKTHREQIAKLIEGLLREPKTIKALFDIASGDKTPAQFLDQIFKDDKFNLDNLLNLIPTIIGQKNINTQTLKDLGQIILDSGVVATGVDALPASVDEAGKAKISGLIEEILQDPSKLVDNVLEAIPVSFIQSNKAAIASIINDLLSTPEMRKKFVSFITGGKTVSDLYHTISEGGFSVANLMKQIPVILGNQKVDTDFIDALFKAIEDSGLLPAAVSTIAGTMINPDTPASKQVVATLFKNGALTHIYEEVMNIMKTGAHGQLDTDANTAESVKRYTELFREFQAAFPAINGVDATETMTAVADFLRKGIGLSSTSQDSLIELLKAALPTQITGIVVAPLADALKDVLSKPLKDLTETDINSILDVVGKFVPIVQKVKPYVYKILHGGMTLDELNAMVEAIKPGLLKTELPSPIGDHVSDAVKSLYTGNTWLSGGGIFGFIAHPVNSVVNSLLKPVIKYTHILFQKGVMGMTSDEIKALLDAVKSDLADAGSLSTFVKSLDDMLKPILKITDPVLEDTKTLSDLVINLFSTPISGLNGDDVNSIISLVNNVLGKDIPEDLGDSLVNLLNNGVNTDPKVFSEIVKNIEKIVKVFLQSGIPDSIQKIIDSLLPTVFVGNDGIVSEKNKILTEFKDLKNKIHEEKLVDMDIDVTISGKTFDELLKAFNLNEDLINSDDLIVMENALTSAKSIEKNIEKHNSEVEEDNNVWNKFVSAKAQFISKYKMLAMTTITASDDKNLKNAFEAVLKELNDIYKKDVSKEDILKVGSLTNKIKSLDDILDEINIAINSLNGDPNYDVSKLTDKITNIGIVIKGLSPIDPTLLTELKIKFAKANDDEVSPTWKRTASLKAQILLKFLDDNWGVLFGNVSKSSDISSKIGSFDSFVTLGKFARGGKNITSGHVKDVVSAILSKMTHEDADTLQKYVLTPLGL